MNKFLRSLDITFRRDPTNLYVQSVSLDRVKSVPVPVLTRSSRPRINKMNSLKDNEQKRACRPHHPAIR